MLEGRFFMLVMPPSALLVKWKLCSIHARIRRKLWSIHARILRKLWSIKARHVEMMLDYTPCIQQLCHFRPDKSMRTDFLHAKQSPDKSEQH